MPQIDLGQVVGPPGQDGADGQDGAPGAAAAITGASASAVALSAGATPTAAVTAGGTDAARSFAFTFGIPKGDTGAAGPNSISSSTATTLTGILKGNGSTVGTATVDSTPDSSHTNNLITSAGVADALAKEIIKVNFGTLTGTGSSVTVSKSNAKITADHELIGYELGSPMAQVGALTVTTSAGAVSVSGAINGSTTLVVYLGLPGTSVT